jgi:DNA polymerase-3 subunit delta
MPAKRKTAESNANAMPNVWAIFGTDELVVKERALELVRQYSPPDAGEFGLEVVDGAAGNADQAIQVLLRTLEALQTLPFFGGGKVVWLKDTTVFKDDVSMQAESVVPHMEALMNYVKAGLPADIYFICNALQVDQRRRGFLMLKSMANVEVHNAIDSSKSGWEKDVLPTVEKKAKEYGLYFDADALELFVMRAGEQSRQITNELEKLDLYLGQEDRDVTVEVVRSIVAESHGGVIWDLSQAITQRDISRALQTLDQLISHGQQPVGILLAGILPRVRSLFQTKAMLATANVQIDWNSRNAYADFMRALPEAVKSTLPKKKDSEQINGWPLFFSAKESGNFTHEELLCALEQCLVANQKLVTSSLDPRVVLSMLLLRMLGHRGRNAPGKSPARKPAPAARRRA